jgi:phosphonate transport system substrate-binding protein
LLFLALKPASGQALQILEVGIFPRGEAEATRQMFQPLMDHLQHSLGVRVNLDVPPDYQSFWRRLQKGKYDLVHVNQYHYLRAHQQLGFRAILKNEERGRAEISSVIWVRKDSDIRTAKNLAGRKIIFGGGESAMVSSIMARDLLSKVGLPPSDYLPQYAMSPVQALVGLYFQQGSAAAAGDTIQHHLSFYEDMDSGQLRPLLKSEPVAHLPWAVGPSIDEILSKRIQYILSGLKETPKGRRLLARAGLTSLVPASDADYDIHRQIIQRVLGERY